MRFKSRRCCIPKGRSPSVRACHGGMPRRGRTCPGLPWGPTVPVASLLFHGGLSETLPQPRAVFLMVCIVSGGILEITSSCGTFIILVTSASSSLRNRHDAPLMPASDATGWAKPLPSSIRPRLAKVSGWQTPRRPHDSDGPVPVCGVRAFPVGPGREGRGEPRMRLPKQRGGLPVLLSGSRQPGCDRG